MPSHFAPLAVLLGGTRSPFVQSFGALEDCDTLELLCRTTDALLKKNPIPLSDIKELGVGSVVPSTLHPNVARDTVHALGLPAHIAGYTANRGCLSGLQIVKDVQNRIQGGNPGFYLAGAVECWSDVPIVYSREARKFLSKLGKAKSATTKLSLLKSFPAKAWLPQGPMRQEPFTGKSLGELAQELAFQRGISRDDQDAYAWLSHSRTLQAEKEKRWDATRVPLWPGPRYTTCVSQDTCLQEPMTQEKLRSMEPWVDPVFGTLTHGNTTHPCDGAAVCLLSDQDTAQAAGLKIQAEIIDIRETAFPLTSFLQGTSSLLSELMTRNQLTFADIGLFELHEGSAAQLLVILQEAGSDLSLERLNIRGGALALGHPYGASGLRMLMDISEDLQRLKRQWGVVCVNGSGGMASAILLRNPSFSPGEKK